MPEEKEIKVKIDRRSEGKIKLDPASKPIMSSTLEEEVHAAIAMYANQKEWKDWGLTYLRDGGPVVLFEGPPGTGKTTIAKYLSALVGRGFVNISMKEIGGKAPGDAERNIANNFEMAQSKGWATVFLDECDTILGDRNKVGADSNYLVGITNALLQRCTTYKGLIVLATNRPLVLDPALESRLIAHMHIPRPQFPEIVRLWQQKIPRKFPVQLTRIQMEELAQIPLTGREIENAIIRCASRALITKSVPTFATLQDAAKYYLPK